MSDSDTLLEMRDLLKRVVELLEPVADNYQQQFDEHRAQRVKDLREAVQGLLTTPARRKAWDKADGQRTQAAIAREARLDQGDTSRLFRELRSLGVLDSTSQNPKRNLEL